MSHEAKPLSEPQRQVLEELAEPDRKLKWDGAGAGFIIPGWRRVHSGTLRTLKRRQLLRCVNKKPDAMGLCDYAASRRGRMLRCDRCKKRRPAYEFGFDRTQRKRQGRNSICRFCERLCKLKKNGRPPRDLRTFEERYADARAKLDPGPHPDVQAQCEALRL